MSHAPNTTGASPSLSSSSENKLLLFSAKWLKQQKKRQEYLAEIAKIEPCVNVSFVKTICLHKNNKVSKIVCGKLSCAACCHNWTNAAYWKIRYGLELHADKQMYFGTPTFAEDLSVEEAMEAWRKLQKYIMTKFKGAVMCRVFEATKRGRPHPHFITSAPLPEISKALKNESKASFYARQTPEGKKFIDKLMSLGFGKICHIEKMNHDKGGINGLASYLAKYLSKAYSKSLERLNGRRVRVIEFSRNWIPKQVPYFPYNNASSRVSAPPEDFGFSSLICGCDTAKYGSSLYIDQINNWCASLPSHLPTTAKALSIIAECNKLYARALSVPYSATRQEVERSKEIAQVHILKRNNEYNRLKAQGFKGTLTFLLYGISKDLFSEHLGYDSAGDYLCDTFEYTDDYLYESTGISYQQSEQQ